MFFVSFPGCLEVVGVMGQFLLCGANITTAGCKHARGLHLVSPSQDNQNHSRMPPGQSTDSAEKGDQQRRGKEANFE